MNTLRQAVQEYLTLRRSLGFKLRDAGKLLQAYVKFMEEQRAPYITTKLALAWAQQPSAVQPAEWARRLSVVRIFARHRSATDPRTQIPPEGLLPYRPKRARPYLYSAQEIRCFLRAALSLPARGGLRPWTYHCLFGLLSVTGMRIGEARNLELQDVDLRTGVLTIRSGKFGKSRLIPIHASTRRVLADYLDVTEGGLHVRSPLMCFSPTGATSWTGARSTERSMRYPARSGCAADLTVMGLVCMT
jgi:integrase/recombinase XerD